MKYRLYIWVNGIFIMHPMFASAEALTNRAYIYKELLDNIPDVKKYTMSMRDMEALVSVVLYEKKEAKDDSRESGVAQTDARPSN